jgi:hypothetical protein
VVIAVGAILVGLLELLGVLAKALLALFAGEDELELLAERVGFILGVAFGAVEPFAAWRGIELRLVKGEMSARWGRFAYSRAPGWRLGR